MNLYKAQLVDIWFKILYGQFSDICDLILDLKASTDSNLFKLFGSSFHILGLKYAKEFNPHCTVFIGIMVYSC